MGDAFQPDGRKRRIEATQLRKTVFGKKHSRLDDTKVRSTVYNISSHKLIMALAC